MPAIKKKGGKNSRTILYMPSHKKTRIWACYGAIRPIPMQSIRAEISRKNFFAAEKFSPAQKSIGKNLNPYDSAAPESPRISRMTPTAMWKNMPTYPRFPHRGSFVPLFVVHICTTKGGAKGVTIGGTNGGARFLEHAALPCSCKSSNDKGSRCSGSSQKSLVPVSLT